MDLLRLTYADVRALAGPTAFELGLRCWEQGRVIARTWRPGELSALIRCTRVWRVRVREEAEALAAACTCQYWAVCGHEAATLIAWMEEPETFERKVGPERVEAEAVAILPPEYAAAAPGGPVSVEAVACWALEPAEPDAYDEEELATRLIGLMRWSEALLGTHRYEEARALYYTLMRESLDLVAVLGPKRRLPDFLVSEWPRRYVAAARAGPLERASIEAELDELESHPFRTALKLPIADLRARLLGV